jgi:2-methylcitrate dehydratase PrpD
VTHASGNSALGVLSRWAAGCGRGHGAEAIARAHAALIDTLGCMLAGAGEQGPRRVRATISAWGDGSSTVVCGAGAPAPWAALANGTAAHALDFDDNDIPAASHPSAVLVPAILALAEAQDRRLDDVLDAYIVGLEVMARVGEAVNMGHYARGWHATSTIGGLGAAAACGRLLGLDEAQMGAAISIATSSASGYQSQFGTMTKPLHAGLAAKNGLVAASLAAQGLRASDEALDGAASFLTLLADKDARGFRDLENRLGNPLAIAGYGLSVKRYPCCYYLARSLDAVLHLRSAHHISTSDVTGVVITMLDRNAGILRYPQPGTVDEARFSAPYCVAVALQTGALRISDFHPDALSRPGVRALMPRIHLHSYASSAGSGDLSADEPDTIEIQLESGERLSKTVAYSYGSARDPLSMADLLEKFRDCAQVSLSPAEVEVAVERVSNPDVSQPVRSLTRMLQRFPGRSGEASAG